MLAKKQKLIISGNRVAEDKSQDNEAFSDESAKSGRSESTSTSGSSSSSSTGGGRYHSDSIAAATATTIEMSDLRSTSSALATLEVPNQKVNLDDNGDNHFQVSWYKLDYVVESKWYKLAQQRKPILNSLSGSFRSGELTAILGPSGAGKSTLIDCLVGKNERGLRGSTKVTYSSAKLEEERRRKRRTLRIATIPQEDHLLDSLTVAETFMFASRLKNAHRKWDDEEDDDEEIEATNVKSTTTTTTTRKQKQPFDHKANVQRVIDQLHLNTCAKLKCAKLSGGQYKRVSIGQELLSRPDVMILDEPTSGLDSLTCYNTVLALRQLIENSPYPMAIVATIHQPDIEVFGLFHKAYVLASGGRAIYEGPADNILDTVRLSMETVSARRKLDSNHQLATFSSFNTSKGGDASPDKTGDGGGGDQLWRLRAQLEEPHCNPARLIVELAAGGHGLELSNVLVELQVAAAAEARKSTGIATNTPVVERQQQRDINKAPTFDYEAHEPRRRRAQLDKLLRLSRNNQGGLRVYLRHLAVHTQRSWLTILRDPMLFSVQVLLHIFVPLLISYSFSQQVEQLGSDACPRVGQLDVLAEAYRPSGTILDDLNKELRSAFENLGYMFFQIYVIIFAAVCVTSLTYPLVMHVLLKEYRNGWYSLSAYFLGRTLADLPVPTVNVIIAMAISYHLTGQPLSPYGWRFAAVAGSTVLATLVAQTWGLAFGALLMNAPQAAVFVAPASTAPLVVVSGFLIRIKSLPWLLQTVSQLSYFTHLINAFIVARYGFNRCPCSPEDFVLPDGHQVPSQARSVIDLWVESFADEYSAVSNSSVNATTTAASANYHPTDLVGKLVDTISLAKTFGEPMDNCSQVKPFTMIDYDLNDAHLAYSFGALIIMLLAFRWLTFLVLRWKIHSSL